MNVTKTKEDSTLKFELEGRLDTATAPEFEEELKNSIEGVTELIIDFEKLDYISSAGLRVLLSAQKTMNKQGSMKVLHVNDIISEIFEVSGFSEILTIE